MTGNGPTITRTGNGCIIEGGIFVAGETVLIGDVVHGEPLNNVLRTHMGAGWHGPARVTVELLEPTSAWERQQRGRITIEKVED
jgi:hypothetical protein